MAGMFDTYRHHKKLIFSMILLAMVLFLVGGSLLGGRNGGPGSGYEDPVVATWKFGKIHGSDVQREAEQQTRLNRYFAEVLQRESQAAPVSQAAALDEILLVKKAEQMGIVVSDDKVRDELRLDVLRAAGVHPFVLQSLANDKARLAGTVSNTELARALERVRLSQEQLFAIERKNIMARRVQELFARGLQTEPPGEMWDNYLREKLKITAEIVELPVADYVDRVPDPSESVFKQFFENNKDKFAHDGLPGFRQPYKASFQYFMADITTFLKPAEANITDEQVKDFYDTHKDQFKDLELPKDKDTDKKDADKKDADKKDPDKKDMEKKDGAAKDGDKQEPKPDVKNDAPPAENKDAAKPADDKKTSDTKTPDKKAPDQKTPDKKPAAKTGASLPQPSGVMPGGLAAFNVADGPLLAAAPADKKTASPAADTKKADPATPADNAKKADDAAKAPSKVDKTPADDKGADDQTAAPDKTPADDKKSPDDKKPAADDKKPASDDKKPGDEKTPPKYKPLEAVKDDIRRMLALGSARKAADEALQTAAAAVTKYGEERSNWRVDVLTTPKSPEPPAPNFAETAKAHGLLLQNTGLLSREELLKLSELRGAFFPVDEQHVIYFANKVFSGSMPEYKPQLAQDVNGNRLMVWLDDEKKENVPEFDKIKAEVKQAWKTMEARKLAKQEADRLVAVAKKDPNAPLKESLTKEGKEVKSIGPFIWKTSKLPNSALETSAIGGIDDAGDEFMRAAYSLEEGEVGTAWNQPKNACFVVRVDRWEPSRIVLATLFQSDAGSRRFGDRATLQALYRRWLDSLKEEFGLHLDKDFDKGRQMQDTASMPGDDEE